VRVDWEQSRKEQLERAQPYNPELKWLPGGFSVSQRDTHHWDIFAKRRPGYVHWYYAKHPDQFAWPLEEGELERYYRIRGEPGAIQVLSEAWDPLRPHPRPRHTCLTVAEAMAYISQQLMG
jgi:hypothetical protein